MWLIRAALQGGSDRRSPATAAAAQARAATSTAATAKANSRPSDRRKTPSAKAPREDGGVARCQATAHDAQPGPKREAGGSRTERWAHNTVALASTGWRPPARTPFVRVRSQFSANFHAAIAVSRGDDREQVEANPSPAARAGIDRQQRVGGVLHVRGRALRSGRAVDIGIQRSCTGREPTMAVGQRPGLHGVGAIRR